MNKVKADFVASIFDRIPEFASNDFAKSEIIGFLLKNINNGKLYKYRAVTGNSIKNLEDNTLYCASPSTFNDPFDCKIGVDYSSFFLYRYSSPIEELVKCFVKFLNIYDGDLSYEECSEKEVKVFTFWENANELMGFIHKFRGTTVSDDDIVDTLTDNPLVIKQFFEGLNFFVDSDILLNVLKNSLTEAFKYTDRESIEAMIDLNSSYHDFANKLGIMDDADEIELTNKIFKKYFPEQSENAEKADFDLTNLLNGLSDMMDEKFKVGCLCTDYKNRLMWSHYADSHRGFCIEYDFSKDCRELDNLLILPVIYSNHRVKIPWEVALSGNISSQDLKIKGAKHMIQSLVTKDDIWSYEDEWRVIMLGDTGNQNIKMPPISCIYLGALCNEADKAKIMEIANRNGIQVKQMTVDRGEYTLHASPIKT